MRKAVIFILLSIVSACASFPDRPKGFDLDRDMRTLSYTHLRKVHEALYDERRVWELCDGVNFGCIIDPHSRITITIQLEGTALIGHHGIWSGLKRNGARELQTTNDDLWYAQPKEPVNSEETYHIEDLLYYQAVQVWKREMKRLVKR